MNGYISVSDAAKRLGRSIEQVRRYLREGRLAGRRIGQQWFVEEAAVAGRRRIGEAAAAYEVRTMRTDDTSRLEWLKEIGEIVGEISRDAGELRLDVADLVHRSREEH